MPKTIIMMPCAAKTIDIHVFRSWTYIGLIISAQTPVRSREVV